MAALAQPAAQRPAALNAYVADWLAGGTTKLRVFSDYVPDSDDGRALVERIRAIPPPDRAQVLTGGLPSRSADFTASFGALVWIFQQGHLSTILGFESSGTIAAWQPIIMFSILFGLSMDYEVLL